MTLNIAGGRRVKAFHGRQALVPDPSFEMELADYLRCQYDPAHLVELYGRFAMGDGKFDRLMRRVLWRSLTASLGQGSRLKVP